MSPQGRCVVVWDSNHRGGDWDVEARILKPDGTPQTDEFRVTTTAEEEQSVPSVAADQGGHFLVAWQAADGDELGVFCRAFDFDGKPRWKRDLQINTSTAGSQCCPQVASNGTNFLVTWQSSAPENPGIFGQLLALDGDRIGLEYRAEVSPKEMAAPCAVFTSHSEWVTTWQVRKERAFWTVNAQKFAVRGMPRDATRPAAEDTLAGGHEEAAATQWTSLTPLSQGPDRGTVVPVHQNLGNGKQWTATLGEVPAGDLGKTARTRVETLGFRLPTLEELQEMYSYQRGGDLLEIHAGPQDLYETRTPDILGSASKDGFRRPLSRQATQSTWYLGVKNPSLNAVVYHPTRNALFFFRGNWYQQFDLEQNRVVRTSRIDDGTWQGVWTDGFDAAVYHPVKEAIYFFRGNEYVRFRMEEERVDKAAQIDRGAWKGVWTEGLDAALYHPWTESIYFFRGNRYRRFDLMQDQVVEEGPIGADHWKGLWTNGIDAAVYHPGRHVSYFFRGGQYQRSAADSKMERVDGEGEIGDGDLAGRGLGLWRRRGHRARVRCALGDPDLSMRGNRVSIHSA